LIVIGAGIETFGAVFTKEFSARDVRRRGHALARAIAFGGWGGYPILASSWGALSGGFVFLTATCSIAHAGGLAACCSRIFANTSGIFVVECNIQTLAWRA
jgi:hypothetical protein